MVGLSTVFKQVFSEGLKDQGFQKIKGRHPYLVRVVEGGEIIHVISCRNQWCGERGYKEFEILGNVHTVYNDSVMDFTKSPTSNVDFGLLITMGRMYADSDLSIGKDDYYRSIVRFLYKPEDADFLREQMKQALAAAKKVLIPIFDKTVTLEACIDYCQRYGFWSYADSLYIKTDNHEDLTEERDKMIAEEIGAIKKGISYFSVEEAKERGEKWRVNTTAHRDKIFNDPVLYAKEMETMEKNRLKNIEALGACGVEL